MKYEFKDRMARTICKVDAQKAGTEIENIRVSNGGIITPISVLDKAKKHNSPLHNAFEWDNKKAADKFRIGQSRNLIRSIVIIENENGKEKSTPAFLNVKINDSLRSYTDIKTIKQDEGLTANIEKQAIKDLNSWINRYRSFTGLLPLSEEIKSLIKKYYSPIDEVEEILTQEELISNPV